MRLAAKPIAGEASMGRLAELVRRLRMREGIAGTVAKEVSGRKSLRQRWQGIQRNLA